MKHSLAPEAETAETAETAYSAIARELCRHPVRLRIVGWLAGRAGGHTQREIGKALSLSTAAVHYHIKLLEGVDMAHVASTRAGPNGITEKLYAVDPRATPLKPADKAGFYVEYTLSHMQEMQREAGELLEAEPTHPGYAVGCFETFASAKEIARLKHELLKRINQFHSKHCRLKKGTVPAAITLGVMPSKGAGWTGVARVMDFG